MFLRAFDSNASPTSSWPTASDVDALITALDTLLRNNSYDLPGYGLVHERNGRLPYFDVDVARIMGSNQFIDIMTAFQRQHPGRPVWLADYVIIFPLNPTNCVQGGRRVLASANVRYVMFPPEARFKSALCSTPAGEGTPDELATILAHEIGHIFREQHAQTQVGASASLGYGDVFDYMGWMHPSAARFNSSCFSSTITSPCSPGGGGAPPAPTTQFYAPASQVHTNPISKLHHGWLTDSSFDRLTQPDTSRHLIKPIAHRAGIRAIEIPVGFQSNIPYSLVVFWREHEPVASCGACVTLVSRQQASLFTKLLSVNYGQELPENMGCNRFNGTLDPWEAILRENMSISYDPSSGRVSTGGGGRGPVAPVVITCASINKQSQDMCIQVTVPAGLEPHINLPILDVICPEIERGDILTNSDIINVRVEAAVPDNNPKRIGWQGIKEVSAVLRISAGENQGTQVLVYRMTSPVFPGQPVTTTFLTGHETWSVDLQHVEGLP